MPTSHWQNGSEGHGSFGEDPYQLLGKGLKADHDQLFVVEEEEEEEEEERERDRQTDIQTETERERETETDKERQRQTQREGGGQEEVTRTYMDVFILVQCSDIIPPTV